MRCSRGSCKNVALASCKLFNKQRKVVVSELDETFKGVVHHLCGKHANRMVAPSGWEMVREVKTFLPEDDVVWEVAQEADQASGAPALAPTTPAEESAAPTTLQSVVEVADTAILEAISAPRTPASEKLHVNVAGGISEGATSAPSTQAIGSEHPGSQSLPEDDPSEDDDLTVIMRHVGNDYSRPRDIPLEFQGAKRKNLIALRTGDTGVNLKKIKKSLQE
jgi:hypothetical protein